MSQVFETNYGVYEILKRINDDTLCSDMAL